MSNGVVHKDVNGILHEEKSLSSTKSSSQPAPKGEAGIGTLLFCVGGIYASLYVYSSCITELGY